MTRRLLLLITAPLAFAENGDRLIKAPANVSTIAFAADGKWIAAQCRDEKIRLYDPRTGELKKTHNLDKGDSSVTFPLRSDQLALIGSDKKIKVKDLISGDVTKSLAPAGETVRRISLSPDRKLIAGSNRTGANGSEETVRVWDPAGKQLYDVPAGVGGTSVLAFSPDGAALVAGSYDTNLRAWSSRNGELLRLIEEIPVATFAAVFSPDGNTLATAGADRTVYLWDAKTFKLRTKLPAQPEMISALAFSPDGRLLMTGGFSVVTDRAPVKVMIWDLAAGKIVRSMDAPHQVGSVAFSGDGTLAVATSSDDQIHVWSVPGR